ncbi:hypothetical protein [Imhoffiella purpurea]|uniref:Uncharacterized protein n=1 Tax=Imhoffiella purpurea TaxID=1249627 RepID=W9W3C0_9GAMM|nr:hypothetical protein [Imhoffiella purpurea]EXJ17065.1 hypothetical protein D779_0817 [Imhoffiella purpurea]
MKRYSLTLSGETHPGTPRHEAVAALAELLRLTLPRADTTLDGRPHRLEGSFTLEQAKAAQQRFEGAGIDCLIREEVRETPPTAAAVFDQPGDFGMDATDMRCPSCDELQPSGEICRACGIAFAKFDHARGRETASARQIPISRTQTHGFPYRLVNQLLLLVFLSSIGLLLWSGWKKGQFPPADFYDQPRLTDPRQTPTATEPFQIEAEGVAYRIDPLFDYALDGVVVSLHDSDVFWDIYHFKDWKDFINIRDLCVVWGDNVSSGAFRGMDYKNTTWTCWVSTRDPVAAGAFAPNQLSNNHLLTHSPYLYRAIKSAEIGDQIHFSGKLVSYSHAGGFSRGTSTRRDDSGNGACETVYVEDFQITRTSNPGWRLIHRIASGLALVSLIGLAILFFVAPYRPHR